MTAIEAETNRKYAKATRMIIHLLREERARNARLEQFSRSKVRDSIDASKHELWDREAIDLVKQNRSRHGT